MGSFMDHVPTAQVKRVAEDVEDQTEESALVITGIKGRIDRAVWGPLNRTIITAGEDTRTLTLIKTYATEQPVNAADISPTHDTVVLGGGQDAMNVTMTDRRAGKFEAKFYHKFCKRKLVVFKDILDQLMHWHLILMDGVFQVVVKMDMYHFDSDYFNIKI